jgi:hypothetical protein
MRSRSLPVLLLLLPAAAVAQTRDRGPLLLELPMNTRALAMGGAFGVGTSDADAIFHNPALSDVAGVTLSAHRFAGGSTLFALAGAAEWWGGRVGVGVQTLAYGTSPASRAAGRGEGMLAGGGLLAASEAVASVSFARRVFGVRTGLTAKWIEQRVAGERGATGAIDVSTGLTLAPAFAFGLAVQDIGPGARVGADRLQPPTRVLLGAATTRGAPVGPLDLSGSFAASVGTDGSVRYGGGLEAGYWPVVGRTFFLRAGLREADDDRVRPYTLGGGFGGDRITLDYALGLYDGGATSHRVALRWR